MILSGNPCTKCGRPHPLAGCAPCRQHRRADEATVEEAVAYLCGAAARYRSHRFNRQMRRAAR